mmetsp:Transcript_3599/g.10456  ORF Transcript_3599/g.10456 Transcript_3599/m.10456 type:complete len:858 (-) Transcript_3599:898-3471(-)|eukprot:CAMPEP_0206137632 /NCGR_PEP_ID=MMETSP1473-20131121/2721_1 /ASSEMBLY_ACC=CAM_ASM_001109 /TAXON_ID=1461547 /ORGANISM="Stichococcus sp, Strain RCC1054" /LENGTH=857 /DNA_ID=CAMNT_0053530817 /DNA_START=103 /DNA_END=2676 /DNA_ORIENTATION=+
MSSHAPILQVVDKNGNYATEEVQKFAEKTGLDRVGKDYQIVAIMGPQSSGKSTLLNSVFGTSFVEMDALSGRQQTTRGIWMARSPKIESQVHVMDLEGSDGRERGEDDTSFERQSALFALAAADVMLINMWAKDIGRETGAGKPLLKTIFQVNLKLFTPAPDKRRTVLLFVFRDRTRTPLPRLIETWQEDLNGIWESIPKPTQYDKTSVSDFFEVQYSALPNFEEREEEFRAESVILRRRFTDQEEDTLVRPAEDKLPGQALALSMQKLWQVIREQKDLNLPAHKVMVANIRCKEIAAEQLQALLQDQAWLSLQSEAAAALVSDFGARATALLHSCLTGYDEEARYFESAVRADKRQELVAQAYAVVATVRHAQLDMLRKATLDRFKADLAAALDSENQAFTATAAGLGIEAVEAFEEAVRDLEVEGSGWTAAEAHSQLEDDIAVHVRQLEQAKVAAVTSAEEAQLRETVTGQVVPLLDGAPPNLWPRLQRVHADASAAAADSAFSQLKGYELSAEEKAALKKQLESCSRKLVESLVREASHTVLSRMKDRFGLVFSRDDGGMPRSWTPRVDIAATAAAARREAAAVLALLACLRLDAPPAACAALDAAVGSLADQPDHRASRAGSVISPGSSVDGGPSSAAGDFDMLSGSDWPEMAKGSVLLSPQQCRGLWRQFMSDSDFLVGQAMATQEANRAASNRAPPLWAIVAMVVLGWNEFFAVLRNPLWLLLLVFTFLFGKTVYQDLEVDAEMQRGLLPGLLVLGSKLGPTMRSAASRTVAGIAQFAQEAPQRAQETYAAVRSPANSTALTNAHGESLRRRRDSGIEMTDGGSFTSQQRGRSPPRKHLFNEIEADAAKNK